MLSSHIEGYIEDLGEVALDRIVVRQMKKSNLDESFLYFCSKDLIEGIRSTGDPTRIAQRVQELWRRDDDIWSNSACFKDQLPVRRFLRGFANPKIDEIRKFFTRFGYQDYTHDLATLLRASYPACANMVDQVVDQRNKIAHGDMVVTGTPNDLRDMIRLIQLFCRSTDRVVDNWFARHGCPIR